MYDLKHLIDQHLLAIGGEERLRKVHSIKMTGDRIEGDTVMEGFQVVRARPNKLRVSISNYSEGFSGEYSWENNDGDKKKVEGVAKDALLRAATWPGIFRTWKDVLESDAKVELMDQTYNSNIGVEITLQDGYRRRYYFNPNSFLNEYFEDVRPLHPGEVIRRIGTKNSEFKKVDGIMMSFTSEQVDLDSNEVLVTNRWNEIIINPELPPDFFELN